MRNRAPFPARDNGRLPPPDEHVVFVLLDMERAIQEGRMDDAWRDVSSLAVAAANARRPLNADELRVMNRVVSTGARASLEVW